MCSLTGRQGPCKSSLGEFLQGRRKANGPLRHRCCFGGCMANLFRLAITGALLLLAAVAQAALPMVTVTEYSYGGTWYASAQAACGAWLGAVSGPGSSVSGPVSVVDGYRCNAYYNGASQVLQTLGTRSTSSCPADSMAVGSQCICNTGYAEVGGACVGVNPDRTACWNWSLANSLPGGQLVTTQRLQGKIAHGTQFCVDIGTGYGNSAGKGCKVTFDLQISMGYGTDAAPQWVSEGQFDFATDGNTVDQSCNLGPGEQPKPAPPVEKCPNGYTGTVNGVEVCVNKVPNSGADGGSSETETNDGTETTTRRVDRSTNCDGEKCTTTTTTTTTRRNNSTGATTTSTTTETTTTSKPGFCQENPTSKLCKDGKEDGSSFGGSCAAGFSCEGDAIQCAMAQEQHRRACKLFDDKSQESQLYEAEKSKGKDRDVTATLPGNETIDVSSKLSRENLLGGAACISDLNIQVWGQAVSLPISTVCPALGYLGYVLVTVASLAAFRIVSGATKGD